LDASVDERGGVEPIATVHHAVARGVDALESADERGDVGVAGVAVPALDVAVGQDGVVRAEQAQLEAARTGVDDEDAHVPALPRPRPVADVREAPAVLTPPRP